jgi:hypothetical protein
MPTRLDVELTSSRPDGTWTWRAAGARQPKGVVGSEILPDGAKIGDVLKVEVNIGLDGIEIVTVVPTRTTRKEPELLEIIGPERDVQPITTNLARREGRPRDRRHDRPDGDRPRDRRGDRRDRSSQRSTRPPRRDAGDHRDSGARDGEPRPRRERAARPSFTPPPELPQRPKPKRLKPGRAHRKALLEALPEAHRPVADQLLRGGLPAVRQALREQNDALRAAGQPEITASGIESLAQDLVPRVRIADWLDRADAARAALDELDLRDLRSVVTAGADPVVERDAAARSLAEELRAGLDRRQDEEHALWLADIGAALDVGRVVRALRLSSRPPKAGVPFPSELASRLTGATTEALTADAPADRWAAVVEALALAPVHASVVPAAPPAEVNDTLRGIVAAAAASVPEIAKLLGVEPLPAGSRPRRPPRLPRRSGRPGAPPPAGRAPAPATASAVDPDVPGPSPEPAEPEPDLPVSSEPEPDLPVSSEPELAAPVASEPDLPDLALVEMADIPVENVAEPAPAGEG